MSEVDRLQVLDGRGTTQIEEVVPDTEIAGASTLALSDVGQSMLNADTMPQLFASTPCGAALSQSLLKSLVGRDAHGATSSRSGPRAARAQGAPRAVVGMKLDHSSEANRLSDTCRARDGEVTQVQPEVGLGELIAMAVACDPRLANNVTTGAKYGVNERAVDVATVDVQLLDSKILPRDIRKRSTTRVLPRIPRGAYVAGGWTSSSSRTTLRMTEAASSC